jgi:hypothetical protein
VPSTLGKPHRVRVAVVAPAQAQPGVVGKLNALPGAPVKATAATLPPGAGTTTVGNTVYFSGHATGGAWLVLACYAVIATVIAVLVAQVRTGRPARAG